MSRKSRRLGTQDCRTLPGEHPRLEYPARVALLTCLANGGWELAARLRRSVTSKKHPPPALMTRSNAPPRLRQLAIPAVVFTDPELAWCGLTETEAQQAKREITVARFPWAASGRALTLDRPDGMTKLLLDPKTERILGVGIVGAGAGELIAEGVLAVEMGANATDMKMSIHPHPTLSETMMESAEAFFGHATHIYRPRRK